MLQLQSVLPNDICLQENRVDIWAFSLKNTDHLSLLSYANPIFLSNQEETRANRFLFSRHQQRFRVAHLTLRVILAHYLKKPIESIVYTENRHGKPYLLGDSLLQFNLSHSRDMGLIAISGVHPLGVDLEYFSSRPYAGIIGSLYSEAEQFAWHRLPKHLQTLGFFHAWAQKEAFIKAIGMGLAYPTQEFTVPVLPQEHSFPILDRLHGQRWQLIGFMPQIACSAALCCSPFVNIIRYISLS